MFNNLINPRDNSVPGYDVVLRIRTITINPKKINPTSLKLSPKILLAFELITSEQEFDDFPLKDNIGCRKKRASMPHGDCST